MFPTLPRISIRQAQHQDISSVSDFVDQAILVHRNLDWQPLLEWIPRVPSLLRFEGDKLTALFSCAPDPEKIAWIHVFAMDHWSTDTNKVWHTLLDPAVDVLRSIQCDLYSVALHDWYKRLLEESGFSIRQNVVVLRWEEDIPPAVPFPPDMLTRPMEQDDLDQVAALDRQAFEPAWVISPASMRHAYMSAAHASVVEFEDRIIGYELSTSTYFSAHLTRLAVSPEYKHANIGYTLTREMINYFYRKGIDQITVNTQDDNTASIGLYKKLGFILTGESFPIYCLGI